jgi:hypothetical protein
MFHMKFVHMPLTWTRQLRSKSCMEWGLSKTAHLLILVMIRLYGWSLYSPRYIRYIYLVSDCYYAAGIMD